MKNTSNVIAMLMLLFLTPLMAQENKVSEEVWQTPTPVFKQEFDWLKLASDEWLKGDIIAMYDGTLEFDSDEMGLQEFDWEDVAELRSKEAQSIRMEDGTIAEGRLVAKDGNLVLVSNGKSTTYDYNQLLSIASSSVNESDLWDGSVSFGVNFSRGNAEKLDYTLSAEAQRRTSTSRFKTTYVLNYSEAREKETGLTYSTADSQRLTSFYDWFFAQKIFLRAAEFEYFSDEFQNIDYRATLGIGLGYKLVESDKMSWDVTIGPSYQQTAFIDVADDDTDKETSAALSLGTFFEYEVTSSIDFDFDYQVQMVSEDAGQYIQTVATGIDVDLVSDFELELTMYLDRTENPKKDAEENLPEKNDYRMVVSLSYDF